MYVYFSRVSTESEGKKTLDGTKRIHTRLHLCAAPPPAPARQIRPHMASLKHCRSIAGCSDKSSPKIGGLFHKKGRRVEQRRGDVKQSRTRTLRKQGIVVYLGALHLCCVVANGCEC